MSTATEGLLRQVVERLTVVEGPTAKGYYVAWCPFHADGEGKPPHKPNLHVWPNGYICHACGRKGNLRQLAAHLGVAVDSEQRSRCKPSNDIPATYDYLDEKGRLLFQVVRRPGKRFYQRRPGVKGGWISNLDGVRRVLYHLPDLLARPEESVFIVEGEKDVETLRERGILATTNPGGAGTWQDKYSEILRDRDVVIVPDNDESGHKHAECVARSLAGTAASIKVVRLPELSEKGDVSDWLASGHTIDELQAVVETTAPWEPNDLIPSEEGPSESQERKTQAARLIGLVERAGVEMFHDERGEAYAAVPLPEGRRILSLASRDFRSWLRRLGWTRMRKALCGEVVSTARAVLEGMARFDGPERPLQVRSAWSDGAIWCDLDGQKAVRVAPGSWEVVSKPPILFRSFPHQRALPVPAKGGDPWRILGFVNMRDQKAGLLLVCYLVAAMVPGVPVPALLVHGLQGTAKTTLLKVVKRVLDPSAVAVRGSVRDPAEFAQAAFQNRVLFFDNLSSLPQWLSDALCRTVTGEGYSKRTLYTDEDTTVFEYMRAIGLSGINLVASRADLLDRSIILALDPIPPECRREERDFWAEFDEALPEILGGLFDALAEAMRIAPDLQLARLPRMADFARWGAAAAVALGRRPKEFLDAYGQNIGRQNEAAIDSSPVAQAILALMQDQTEWQGTPSELLATLESLAQEKGLDTRAKNWPKGSTWVWRRLREVQPNLLTMGIAVSEERTAGRRSITLRRADRNAFTAVIGVKDGSQGAESVTALPSSAENAVTPSARDTQGNDGSDSNDSISGDSSDLAGSRNMDAMPEDMREAYDERVAIMVADGGVPIEEARIEAAEAVLGGNGPCVGDTRPPEGEGVQGKIGDST